MKRKFTSTRHPSEREFTYGTRMDILKLEKDAA